MLNKNSFRNPATVEDDEMEEIEDQPEERITRREEIRPMRNPMPSKAVRSEPRRDSVEVTDVVTATAKAYKLPNGEVVDLESYLAWLGNQIYEIKKSVV